MPQSWFQHDMQAQLTIAQAVAKVRAPMKETVIWNRFNVHMEEMRPDEQRVQPTIENQTLVYMVPSKLQWIRKVAATDLRARRCFDYWQVWLQKGSLV